MFSSRKQIVATLALTLLASLFLGGCNKDLRAERDALLNENVALRSEVDAAHQSLSEAQAQNNALAAQLDEAHKQQPVVLNGRPNAAANFGGISGIDVESGAHGEVIVRVPGDVLFDSGKVALKSAAQKTLSQIASVLKSDYAGKTIRVEGYTDSDPIKKSGWKDNLELSLQRAAAVQRYLVSQGVSSSSVYSSGHGPNNPRGSNSTASGKAQNRRVEIVVIAN